MAGSPIQNVEIKRLQVSLDEKQSIIDRLYREQEASEHDISYPQGIGKSLVGEDWHNNPARIFGASSSNFDSSYNASSLLSADVASNITNLTTPDSTRKSLGPSDPNIYINDVDRPGPPTRAESLTRSESAAPQQSTLPQTLDFTSAADRPSSSISMRSPSAAKVLVVPASSTSSDWNSKDLETSQMDLSRKKQSPSEVDSREGDGTVEYRRSLRRSDPYGSRSNIQNPPKTRQSQRKGHRRSKPSSTKKAPSTWKSDAILMSIKTPAKPSEQKLGDKISNSVSDPDSDGRSHISSPNSNTHAGGPHPRTPPRSIRKNTAYLKPEKKLEHGRSSLPASVVLPKTTPSPPVSTTSTRDHRSARSLSLDEMSYTSASPVATPTSDDLSEDPTAENPMSIQDNAESNSALASSVMDPIGMLFTRGPESDQPKLEDHDSSHSLSERISTPSHFSEQGDAFSTDTESMNSSVQPSRNEASPDNSPPSNMASHSGLHTCQKDLRAEIQKSYVEHLTADSIVVKNLAFSQDRTFFLPYTINLSSHWAKRAPLNDSICHSLETQAREIVERIPQELTSRNAQIRDAISHLYYKCGIISEGSQATEPVDKNLDQYNILQSLANSVYKEKKLDQTFNRLIFSTISMMMAHVDRAKFDREVAAKFLSHYKTETTNSFCRLFTILRNLDKVWDNLHLPLLLVLMMQGTTSLFKFLDRPAAMHYLLKQLNNCADKSKDLIASLGMEGRTLIQLLSSKAGTKLSPIDLETTLSESTEQVQLHADYGREDDGARVARQEVSDGEQDNRDQRKRARSQSRGDEARKAARLQNPLTSDRGQQDLSDVDQDNDAYFRERQLGSSSSQLLPSAESPSNNLDVEDTDQLRALIPTVDALSERPVGKIP